jgi:hypothetical protein
MSHVLTFAMHSIFVGKPLAENDYALRQEYCLFMYSMVYIGCKVTENIDI